VLSRELSLSYTELGLLASGMAFSLGLSQLIFGPLSDRLGRKWLIIAGLLLFAITTILCGLVSTFWPLLFFQVLGGIGGSILHPVGVALLTDVTHASQRGKAMGIHGSGGMLGTAMAPVTMVFLTVSVNWRVAMMAVGVLGILCAPLMMRYLVEPARAEQGKPEVPGSKEDKVYPFSTLALLLILMVWVTRAVYNRAYQTFLPTFLVSRYELSLELSGIFTTIYWIFGAFAWLGGGYLSDRYNRYTILWLSCILTMVSLAIMVFAPPHYGKIIYVNFFLLGLFSFLGAPAYFALYSEGAHKAHRGSFFSLGFTVAYTISALVPGAMGWITDHFNTAASFYPALALAIAAIFIVPVLQRMRNRSEPS
jgi:FSR family fosmidomycin resistance protein-like MFS transporter